MQQQKQTTNQPTNYKLPPQCYNLYLLKTLFLYFTFFLYFLQIICKASCFCSIRNKYMYVVSVFSPFQVVLQTFFVIHRSTLLSFYTVPAEVYDFLDTNSFFFKDTLIY